MPLVLHLLPPDAALACAALEAWIDVGPGFVPRAAWAAAPGRWAMLAVAALPPPTSREPTWRRLWVPADAGPWRQALAGYDVIHLHDPALVADAVRGANAEGTPLVASWPAGAPWVPEAGEVDALLVPTAAEGARLVAAGAPADRLRVAPAPVVAYPARSAGPEGPPRWVAAADVRDPLGLDRLLRAWALHVAAHPGTPPLRLLAGGPVALAPDLLGHVEVARVLGAQDAAAAIASADLGAFPGRGLGWAAETAAAAGLPLVLGREAATAEGWRDQEDALLVDLEPAAIAGRLAFLQRGLDSLSREGIDVG